MTASFLTLQKSAVLRLSSSGRGRSERGLARGLKAAGMSKGDVVIATKWFPLFRRAASIKLTIDRRLRCLDPYGVDLHQVHLPFSFYSVESQMNAMADLVEARKIRSVGVSNFSAGMMRKAHTVLAKRGIPLASNQVRYNLVDRRIERNGVLDTAKELGITVHPILQRRARRTRWRFRCPGCGATADTPGSCPVCGSVRERSH